MIFDVDYSQELWLGPGNIAINLTIVDLNLSGNQASWTPDADQWGGGGLGGSLGGLGTKHIVVAGESFIPGAFGFGTTGPYWSDALDFNIVP
jgi:hypothetical protein